MPHTSSISTAFFFNTAFKKLTLTAERTQLLTNIADCIIEELCNTKKVNLLFICIHNSRRSQLSQAWSHFAIDYFKIKHVAVFSGGSVVTSLNRNTIKTLKEVGFHFQLQEYSHQNPVYSIKYKKCSNPIIAYSKLYHSKENKTPFIAITNCLNTESNCPTVYDANRLFHLPYEDPKLYDGEPQQQEKYFEINMQIAGEIYFIFEKVNAFL